MIVVITTPSGTRKMDVPGEVKLTWDRNGEVLYIRRADGATVAVFQHVIEFFDEAFAPSEVVPLKDWM